MTCCIGRRSAGFGERTRFRRLTPAKDLAGGEKLGVSGGSPTLFVNLEITFINNTHMIPRWKIDSVCNLCYMILSCHKIQNLA